MRKIIMKNYFRVQIHIKFWHELFCINRLIFHCVKYVTINCNCVTLSGI